MKVYGKYGIRTDRYKLIHFYDVLVSWEFYDLETDPNEMNNLYTDHGYEQVIKELEDRLIGLQKEYQD